MKGFWLFASPPPLPGIYKTETDFSPFGMCPRGGFWFTSLDRLFWFASFGPNIGCISVPPPTGLHPFGANKANVREEILKWRTDKIVLERVISDEAGMIELLENEGFARLSKASQCICDFVRLHSLSLVEAWAREQGLLCYPPEGNPHLEQQ